ncbi:DNA topoisomerase IV subunit A [Clostridium estertheticum]|uniref:DNA topoisomerase IV subunit A n=1 Tax=Clostridium estertheticum TaxID=238834 RepID=UPI001CF3C1F9|nr:DNA topoisomerase IV subunit A [Clostridium estertheticum]MCB2308400.1 DNA topoisomerase IV subunit A [Clostridium estertheticum]MCB2347386.1 DNA topoisomerase IV subunit A [Clostridium estertheticum]MCB2352009.1 DNA topoisomerase IV subunit A [Clostridium estertheticum]WAG44461.1 DNA topoisomerase IV subunit A [Clostridium estertheticum]
MAKKIEIPKDNNIVMTPIEEAMPDNYLPYAVEVARERALPDVRDGLKPVHRRILYGAYMLKAFPDKPYYKSARIVGDILGKYHPHGDSSVYGAMVILAQDFATRKPLIDGHGNWGSQDGDNAAAMRYTEARLSPIALEMIRDIDKGVVEMVNNYSDTEKEPSVLPSRYPNLLVNGTFGIAVGIATNIPPHNLGEVIDGLLAYADNNDITTKQLMQYIKGPDLPTGGILIGRNAIESAYETGEGKVTLRSKMKIEVLESGRLGIVITEFPYRKNKAKLLQSISDMTAEKKHLKVLESIVDIRDESDRTGLRSVIEFKKSTNRDIATKVLNYLMKKTELQCNVPFNMVALANGKPQTMSLKTILKHYLNHQKDVVTRRTQMELEAAKNRFHIIEGFIKAIDVMDEIIVTIRGSKSKKDAGQNLIAKFDFTQIQAEAILELMLYRLTGLELKIFLKEYKKLEGLIKGYNKILGSEKELLNVIRKEILEIKEKYNDPRRTKIIEDDSEAKIEFEDIILVEDIMITLSNDGYIKRVPMKYYNRSNANICDIEYREGDFNTDSIGTNTKETLMIFTNIGNVYQLRGDLVPEYKWKEKGERLDTLIRGMDLTKEKIIATSLLGDLSASKQFMFFTNKGNIKKTFLDKFVTSYSKLSALKLKENEKLIDVRLMEKKRKEAYIKIITKEGLEFSIEEPELEATDRNVIGTQLFNLTASDEVVKLEYTNDYDYKEFYISLNAKGVIKISSRKTNTELSTYTKSTSTLLIFTQNGLVHKLPSYMVQNITIKGTCINTLLDNFNVYDKIAQIISVDDFNEEKSLYFFSKKGITKRTKLKELEGDFYSTLVYKLKTQEDKLISVKVNDDKLDKDVIIVTKKAMCIRFNVNTINFMGKGASGVTGISLKENDEVIFVNLIDAKTAEESNDINDENLSLAVSSFGGENKIIKLNNINVQNRAGRGKNLTSSLLDDYIETVTLK